MLGAAPVAPVARARASPLEACTTRGAGGRAAVSLQARAARGLYKARVRLRVFKFVCGMVFAWAVPDAKRTGVIAVAGLHLPGFVQVPTCRKVDRHDGWMYPCLRATARRTETFSIPEPKREPWTILSCSSQEEERREGPHLPV